MKAKFSKEKLLQVMMLEKFSHFPGHSLQESYQVVMLKNRECAFCDSGRGWGIATIVEHAQTLSLEPKLTLQEKRFHRLHQSILLKPHPNDCRRLLPTPAPSRVPVSWVRVKYSTEDRALKKVLGTLCLAKRIGSKGHTLCKWSSDRKSDKVPRTEDHQKIES